MPKIAFISALAAFFAIASEGSARELKFYCDIDQGYSCLANKCTPVEQTVYPARYRFSLDLEKRTGAFKSCPGDKCGPEWPLQIGINTDGFLIATYVDELFVVSPDLRTYQYAWVERDPRRPEGRHKGRCFR